MIQSASIRRAIVLSALAHLVVGLVAWWLLDPAPRTAVEYVDIELAPPAPSVEALPAERVAMTKGEASRADEPAVPETPAPGDYAVDAGIDAPIDAAIDAAIDAPVDAPRRKRPDAAPDAAEDVETDATDVVAAGSASDAGIDAPDDAQQVAAIDPAHGPTGATGSGEGSGSGSDAREGSGSGSGSGSAGLSNEAAVDGAPTTAGTAANLTAYFPKGHTTTIMIRFDRLRGTEWAEQAERLLQPMPDYRGLFGTSDAKVADKLETIIISTPQPQSAIETTLVARTNLARGALRGFLGAQGPVAWSPAKGGLLGARSAKVAPQDDRVFLSPFRGWFLLARPRDLPGLTAPAGGDLDAIEASGRLPTWLSGIRTIEAESGDPRGPALVLTLVLDGKRRHLGINDFGLGIKSFPTPERASLAGELVKQGWILRGNLVFATDADATEFVATAERVRQRVADSRILRAVIGKGAGAIKNLSFARAGRRVSYATSASISDTRAVLTVAAQYLETYFAARRP